LYTYRQKIKIYHKLHLLVYLLEFQKTSCLPFRQQVLPKRWYTSTGLHSIAFQQTTNLRVQLNYAREDDMIVQRIHPNTDNLFKDANCGENNATASYLKSSKFDSSSIGCRPLQVAPQFFERNTKNVGTPTCLHLLYPVLRFTSQLYLFHKRPFLTSGHPRPITDPFIPTNHKPAHSDQSQSGQTPKDLYIKKAIKTADTFTHSYIHSYIHFYIRLYKQKTYQGETNQTAQPQCLVDRGPALPNQSRQQQQLLLEYCRRITLQRYGTPQILNILPVC
jgi:hypothetical protein